MRQQIVPILIFATFGIGLIVIGILSYVKSDVNKPTSKLESNVLALMTASEKKTKEAEEILSQGTGTIEDQKKAKQLLEESIADAKKAAEIQPNNPQTWYYLSQIYKKLIGVNPTAGELAEEALKKSLGLNPNNAKIYDELATVYILTNKQSDAEKVLLAAIKLDPQGANHYYKLGNVYKELGQKEKAKEAYLGAKKLTPEDSTENHAMIDHQLKSLEQ